MKFFSIEQYMMLLDVISRTDWLQRKATTINALNGKPLNKFQKIVLYVLQSAAAWERFPQSLIFRPSLMPGRGLVSLPHQLCWCFAWLEQLVEVLLSANLWYRFNGCCISQVSFKMKNYSWRIWPRVTLEFIKHTETNILPIS